MGGSGGGWSECGGCWGTWGRWYGSRVCQGGLTAESLCLSKRSETTELLIVLSEAERQSLRAGMIEDSNVVTQMLVDIDVEEAKAEQESDHRQLSVRSISLSHTPVSLVLPPLAQAQFREMEGGYHRANVELKAYLRDGWVLPALPRKMMAPSETARVDALTPPA